MYIVEKAIGNNQPTGGQREEHQRIHLVEPGHGGDEYQLVTFLSRFAPYPSIVTFHPGNYLLPVEESSAIASIFNVFPENKRLMAGQKSNRKYKKST